MEVSPVKAQDEQSRLSSSSINAMNTGESTLVVNVGGTRFETYESTLQRFPGTLLSSLDKTSPHYRSNKDEYFFDRDPAVFREVLNFYRTGDFHLPIDVCGQRTKSELEFWTLDENIIPGCCWSSYIAYQGNKEAVDILEKNLTDISNEADKSTAWGKIRCKVWDVLENPRSSKLALIYYICMAIVQMLCILVLILETRKEFQIPNNDNQTVFFDNGEIEDTYVDLEIIPQLLTIEFFCLIVFTIDFVARLVFCPNKIRFFLNGLNCIDLLSILPCYINIVIKIWSSYLVYQISKALVRFCRTFQLFRIFRTVKHYKGFQILAYTLRASIKDMLLMMIFVTIGMVLFASLIHETDPENFPDIPTAFWWAIITMTTVGYGDMYPQTGWGYLIGAFCAMSGILMIGFTVPIIVNNFMLYYTHMTSRNVGKPKETKSN